MTKAGAPYVIRTALIALWMGLVLAGCSGTNEIAVPAEPEPPKPALAPKVFVSPPGRCAIDSVRS